MTIKIRMQLEKVFVVKLSMPISEDNLKLINPNRERRIPI